MRTLLATLLTAGALAGALLVPATTLRAEERRSDDHRYYDRDRRDWHAWNEAEARAHHRYWEERYRGREYRDYNRVNAVEQRNYWRWRHEHPDNLLWR